MKLNMKARLAPAAKGWRAGGRGGRHAKLTHARAAAQDFFFHVEEVQSQLRPGQPLAELKQVKEQYVIFTVFFKKWRDSFATLFPTGFVGSGMDEAEAKTLSFEIGWYLFLLAKLHAKRGIRRAPPPSTRSAEPCRLPHSPAKRQARRCLTLRVPPAGDIVNTYPLFVSVVHLLLAHLPAQAKTAGARAPAVSPSAPSPPPPF